MNSSIFAGVAALAWSAGLAFTTDQRPEVTAEYCAQRLAPGYLSVESTNAGFQIAETVIPATEIDQCIAEQQQVRVDDANYTKYGTFGFAALGVLLGGLGTAQTYRRRNRSEPAPS